MSPLLRFMIGILIYHFVIQRIIVLAKSSSKEEKRLLKKAGCRKEDRVDKNKDTFGILLEKGAWTIPNYRPNVVPEKGETKVFSHISHQRIRNINDREQTVTIEFSLTMQWLDPRIKTNFSEDDVKNSGIALDLNRVNRHIWQPDLYIHNLSNYKIFSGSKQTTSLKLLSNNTIDKTKTLVEWKIESKETIYCNFLLSLYPMDSQNCEFRFGSLSSSLKFLWLEPNNVLSFKKKCYNLDFHLTVIQPYGVNMTEATNAIGFDLKMERILQHFILEFYLPCWAIVCSSFISFIIPLTAIPGRIGLVVTLFLALINIFIHQMVRNN